MAPASDEEPQTAKKQLPIEPIPIKPPETFKRADEPMQPTYVQSKPISHSPKISPSSIPNPNPSVISTKQTESGYSAVGGYPFSIPGYSAFQPVTHPTVTQPSSTSMQPAVSSSNVKSQSDYVPYSNISSDALSASTASVPASSKSSTQGATTSSSELLSSGAVTSTCSSAALITTAVSMNSMPQITSALTVPPISTNVSEPSLPSSTSQFQSLESTQVMTLEQPSSAMVRNRVSSMAPAQPTMTSEPSKEGTPTSMQTTTSKSSTRRTPSEHCQIAADMLMQRGTQEHSIQSSSTLSSDSLNQQLPMATPVTLPSSQATTSLISAMQRIPIEHSIQPPTLQDSSIRRDMLPTPILPSESPHRLPLDHSLSTVPLEASIQRTTTTVPNVLSETSRHHLSMGHSIPSIPNMQVESSMQRMPFEYYMPSMQLMPPELLMRRMQLLQYMQSLQNMTSEPPIALMPHVPPYAMSMLQAQSTGTIQTITLDKSGTTTSMFSSEPIVANRQSVPSITTIPSERTTSMQVTCEEQSTSLVPTKCEPVQGSVIPVSLVSPSSSVSSQAQSLPLDSIQKTPALSSEQSTASIVQTQQSPMSMQNMQSSISRIDQLKPPMSSVQTMPLLSVMDQSIKSTPEMQMTQSVSLSSDTPPGVFAPTSLNKSSIISSESVMHVQQSVLTALPMCTNASEPAVTSITQMPLAQSMPYESEKLFNASMQQRLQEKSNDTMLTSTPSVGIGTSTNKSINTISNLEFANSLESMSIPQSSMSATSSDSMQAYIQTSMPLDSSIHRMHVIHPLPTNSMESDQFKLYTQTATLESSMLQTSLINSTQPGLLTPSKFSTASISYGPSSNVRTNLAPSLPSISTSSSPTPSLASISHMPLPQSMPQLSTSTMSSNLSSTESMQRIQLQHIPFMSIIPSESNSIITKEMIPPLSLVQSMSSMTLAPSTTSMQPISLVDSMPPVLDSLQMMSSNQFSDTLFSETVASHALPVSTAPSLLSHDKDKQNETPSALHDNFPNTSQKHISKNIEDHFIPETKTAASSSEDVEPTLGSLTQKTKDSIANIPLQTIPKETKRKPLERFSLKTSIPISKIDIKSVPNPLDIAFQNPLVKKLGYNALKVNNGPRVEKQIHRHLLIRSAGMESEDYQEIRPSTQTNLTTLISAKEKVNLSDTQSRKVEPNIETKECNLTGSPLNNASSARTVISNKEETNKLGFKANSSDKSINDQNNQIVFIQNKNCTNKKMILTIQQQNPSLILKRKNNDKSPLRFSSPYKKCKEESVTITEHIPSKVVALKRLHQGNCDEDDFENLITENQIYGNKIVVKEKMQGTSQEQDLKLKSNKTKRLSKSETKNIVKPPNFVYLSNVKYPKNIMMYKNNVKSNINFNKDCKVAENENKLAEVNSTSSKSNDCPAKSVKLQGVPVSKENQALNTGNNLLQITSNNNIKTDTVMSKASQNVLVGPKVLQDVPTNTADINNEVNEPTAKPMEQTNNKVAEMPIEQSKIIHEVVANTCHVVETNLQPKATEITITPTLVEEEVSSLDIYEKRKRLRRIKYLLNRGVKDVQKSETKKTLDEDTIITPEKMKAEIYKEFASTRIVIGDEAGDIDSEYEDETKEYESLIKMFSPTVKEECGKKEFLLNFMLGTQETCNEILWNKRERMLQRDKIAAAYIAAGRLDCLMDEDTPKDIVSTPNTITTVAVTQADFISKGSFFQLKQMFLSHLQLKYVKPQHKAIYEITWREILKERKRRNSPDQSDHVFKQPRPQLEKVEINTNSELKILTEIKNSVTENNNLIKKRLDLSCHGEGDSIKILAEKNFSELDRLSKMADRSVKHFSGQDTRKRDLNPGFDSANIQNTVPKLEPPINFPNINIPSIYKIISLKTTSESYTVTSTQATSMDEPLNSAAGVDEMFSEANIDKTNEAGCQTEVSAWPGTEEMIKMYRDFEKARKREVVELTRRNTALKVEGAHITRNASRHSDGARALIAERRNLSVEEGAMKQAIQRLFNAVDVVRNYF